MDENLPSPSPREQSQHIETERVTRRTFLMSVGIALNAVAALTIAVPVVGFLLAPVIRRKEYLRWIVIGKITDFNPGETKLVSFRNPFVDPWDGQTADLPAYVRCTASGQFTVFAINCAHLGCPVRWFSESQLFMCPCHGGVYYADGSRASGPPERGLFTYDVRVEGNELMIDAGQIPTLRNRARGLPCPSAIPSDSPKLVARIESCPGTNISTIG